MVNLFENKDFVWDWHNSETYNKMLDKVSLSDQLLSQEGAYSPFLIDHLKQRILLEGRFSDLAF